ncbi:hypothetical protein B0T19DRAFT_399003 [Cercophora scortea]|uniref:Secreted protein n=1 Tax=Cercophora scortea TaxID=314031 RepID=A0AAE0IXU5_9PEZI|nr:hypothetical protein B0T19DRAFT_399003 [Cercophora scortea]
MERHVTSWSPRWAALFYLASTASALSLKNFQLITSPDVSIGCILAYNAQIPICSPTDFTRGNSCSTGCVNSLTALQTTLQSVCESAMSFRLPDAKLKPELNVVKNHTYHRRRPINHVNHVNSELNYYDNDTDTDTVTDAGVYPFIQPRLAIGNPSTNFRQPGSASINGAGIHSRRRPNTDNRGATVRHGGGSTSRSRRSL